jgi:hypothetical protein
MLVNPDFSTALNLQKFGVVDGGNADRNTIAFQRALDEASAGYIANGTPYSVTAPPGFDIRISGRLEIGSGTTLLNYNSTIRQMTNNIGIIAVAGNALISGANIHGGVLLYNTEQGVSDTNSVGLMMAEDGFVLHGSFKDFIIKGARDGISAKDATAGVSHFFTIMENVLIDRVSARAAYINPLNGGTHNRMVNVWSLQTQGDVKPDAQGFDIRAQSELYVKLLADWHVQQCFSFETCTGTIESLAAESIAMTANNTQKSVARFTNCSLEAGMLKTFNNTYVCTGSGEIYQYYLIDSEVDVGNFYQDQITSGSGYLTLNLTTNSRMDISTQRPSITPITINEFGTNEPSKLRTLNGTVRTWLNGAGQVNFFVNAAPTITTLPFGSIGWNTDPSTAEPIGWVYTGGNWRAFGTIL